MKEIDWKKGKRIVDSLFNLIGSIFEHETFWLFFFYGLLSLLTILNAYEKLIDKNYYMFLGIVLGAQLYWLTFLLKTRPKK